jgi:protein-S-isoprenylcysteine O-methyltransferase Ste14
MDFDATTRPASVANLRLKNLAASAGIVVAACAIYAASPINRGQLESHYGPASLFRFSGWQFLPWAALVYVLLLLAVYMFGEPVARVSKSLRFVELLATFLRAPADTWRRGLTRDERLALLVTLLKAFYGPMMGMSLMGFCMGAWSNGLAIVHTGLAATDIRGLFDRFGFWFLMQCILFVDVLVFTLGYLIESPRLDNRIRSVDPTLLGWAAALVCYPPFNKVTVLVLGSQHSDFPRFDDPTVHLSLNLLLLTLMAIYASASVALGWKASNLTHRGIIARGPYSVIRHPAYTCKNMAWWIGSIPLVSAAFSSSLLDGLQALGSVVGWTAVYVLRALTEEDHLRSVDGEYAVYAQKVRYRFIPGLI